MADNTARVVLTGVDRSGPAFKSAQRNLEALQAEAAALSTRFSAIGAALGVGTMAAFFKSTVNGLDALKDLSQATGSSVENLSALEDIALRTGGSLDTVSSALLKFNKDLNAADPDSNLAETLKQIGLSAEELRKVDPAEALRQVSLAIAQYSDDGQKARLIQELFGKSTRDVAKFLHEDRKSVV